MEHIRKGWERHMWLDVVMEQLLEKVCESGSESCGVIGTPASLPVITRREETGMRGQTWLKASLPSTR